VESAISRRCSRPSAETARSGFWLTSREADCPVQAAAWPGRPASPPLSRCESPRHPGVLYPRGVSTVEFPPRVGLTEGPSEANDQRLRPDARDDALRRPQGLDQVVNQGWVAYFNCHCRCHAPRVAAGEARTSHSRQKRSPVKGRGAWRPSPRSTSRRATATRRLLAPPRDAGKPYARVFGLAFSCELAAERVSHSVSAGHPARDDETRHASGARCT
jgi:hypothetical protein